MLYTREGYMHYREKKEKHLSNAMNILSYLESGENRKESFVFLFKYVLPGDERDAFILNGNRFKQDVYLKNKINNNNKKNPLS